GFGVQRGRLDALNPAGVVAHRNGPAMGQKLRAGVDRARHKDLHSVIFGVICASHLAKSAADTARSIVAERAAAPAERPSALLQQSIMPVSARPGDFSDAD